jgi:uncharacterized protein involved in response to NO
LEETIGRREQKYVYFSPSQAWAILAAFLLCACDKFLVVKQAHLFAVASVLCFLFAFVLHIFSFAPLLRFSHELQLYKDVSEL